MKTLQTLVVTGVTAVALAACSKSDPKVNAEAKSPALADAPATSPLLAAPTGRMFYGGGVVALNLKCSDVGLEPEKDDLKYTIEIGSKFELRDPKHNKTGEKPKKPNDHGSGKKTILDLGTAVEPGKPATIKIVLAQDSGLVLMPRDVVIRGDDNASKMICDVTRESDHVLRFRTFQKGLNPSWGNYNLGLVAQGKDGFELPVYIDPILDNEGADGPMCTTC